MIFIYSLFIFFFAVFNTLLTDARSGNFVKDDLRHKNSSVVCANSHGVKCLANGSFESGDLSGWQSIGAVTVKSFGNSGVAPTQGNYQAILFNHDARLDSISSRKLESVLGLSSGALDKVVNGFAVQGSILIQSVTVKAGDVISFDWNFFTWSENLNSVSNNSYAFLSTYFPHISPALSLNYP